MNADFAPIVLFVYNRPENTVTILNSLSENQESKHSVIYIYCDGPKKNATAGDVDKINQVVRIAENENRFKKVVIVKRDENLGLANSIINGVTEVINQYGRVIVLEDDLIVSKFFLRYMNDALSLYEKESKVGQIGACNNFACGPNFPDYFFSTVSDCLGWATWKDRWQHFNPHGLQLLHLIKKNNLEHEFNVYGSYDMIGLLNKQIIGEVSSWSVRWQAVCLLNQWLTLYPNPSYSNHIASKDVTHADLNIIPPLAQLYIKQENAIKTEQLPQVKEALALGYSGIGDYFGRIIVKNFIKREKKNFIKALKKFFKPKFKPWSLTYLKWSEIQQKYGGYDANNILKKCSAAIELVHKGIVPYERDSVIFDKIEYSAGILDALQNISHENNQGLTVLDFGGGLGSSYYQNRTQLGDVRNLKWCIVEQKNFVEYGKENFENEILKFYYTIDECMAENKPDIIILSSVLQYIENPYPLIEYISKLNIKNIVLDRTAFSNEQNDLLTIQNVPPDIYEASYPCWFFSSGSFIKKFIGYTIIKEFDSYCEPENYKLNGKIPVFWKGYHLIKIDS
ncbi:MAG: methyltransferase, TIGR04325 family [Bacteroidota bacterium]